MARVTDTKVTVASLRSVPTPKTVDRNMNEVIP